MERVGGVTNGCHGWWEKEVFVLADLDIDTILRECIWSCILLIQSDGFEYKNEKAIKGRQDNFY